MNDFTKFIILIIGFAIIAMIASTFLQAGSLGSGGNIDVIPITGELSTTGGITLSGSMTSSESILAKLRQARDDPFAKAVVLQIDSPGGSVVSAMEIIQGVKEVQATGKPVIAWLRETSTSAAYLIATSADKIVASPYTILGSLASTMSYVELSGLMKDYNITYVQIQSGSMKDIGTPFRAPTTQEVQVLQGILNESHDELLTYADGQRNLTDNVLADIGNGMIYSGKQGYDAGLVDYLGGEDKVINVSEELTGSKNLNLVSLASQTNLLSELAGLLSDSKQTGINMLSNVNSLNG